MVSASDLEYEVGRQGVMINRGAPRRIGAFAFRTPETDAAMPADNTTPPAPPPPARYVSSTQRERDAGGQHLDRSDLRVASSSRQLDPDPLKEFVLVAPPEALLEMEGEQIESPEAPNRPNLRPRQPTVESSGTQESSMDQHRIPNAPSLDIFLETSTSRQRETEDDPEENDEELEALFSRPNLPSFKLKPRVSRQTLEIFEESLQREHTELFLAC